MAYQVGDKTIEADNNGYLLRTEDWNEEVAKVIAASEGIELSDKHWEVINYLREEFFDNHEHQPNNREMLKDMGERWGKKVSSKEMYELFPVNPSKQAPKIGGLPETRRKGGY